MYHYFQALTNTSGDSLVGYFARLIDTASGAVVTLASDGNGTPISTVSGVANMAVTDSAGNLSFFVAPGTYHLDIYGTDATTFYVRVPSVPMGVADSGSVTFIQSGTGAETRPVQDELRDTVSVKQFGAVGDGAADDAPAIRACLAAHPGKTILFPLGTYRLGSALGDIPTGTTLSGAGRYGAKLLRDFNGGYMANLLDGVEIDGLWFDGNSGTRTGGGVNIPVGNGNQSIRRSRLIDFSGGTPIHIDCTGTADNQVGGSRLNMNDVEAWRTDSAAASNRYALVHDDPGAAAAGHPITLIDFKTGGKESIDFGACNDLMILGGAIFDCKWSTRSLGIHASGGRWAGLADYHIKGNFTACSVGFGPKVYGDSGAGVDLPGCYFNNGWQDDTATGYMLVYDAVDTLYMPVFKAGASTVTNGTATGAWRRSGGMVHFTATISLSGSVPSGAITTSLPVTADADSLLTSRMSGYVIPAGGSGINLIGGYASSGATVTALISGSGVVTNASPASLGAGGLIQISGWYPV